MNFAIECKFEFNFESVVCGGGWCVSVRGRGGGGGGGVPLFPVFVSFFLPCLVFFVEANTKVQSNKQVRYLEPGGRGHP